MKPPQLLPDWTNRVMFDPERTKRHVESFFIKANDPKARRAVWLKLTVFAGPQDSFGEVWGIWFDATCGHLAAKERFPITRVLVDPERPGIGIGESAIEERSSYGLVRGENMRLVWQLALHDELGAYRPFPAPWLYRSRLLSSKTTTPHPSARLEGHLELWRGADREVIDLSSWRGMQGHNWGKRHAERYAWSHCNQFEGVQGPTFFEAFAAQVRVAGMLTPPLSLGRLVLDGQTYRFDTFKSLRPVVAEFQPGFWRFVLRGPSGELAGRVESDPEHTLGLHYANPDGPVSYCLNSKLARLSLELRSRRGQTRKLVSERAALEVTQRDANHGMRMVL